MASEKQLPYTWTLRQTHPPHHPTPPPLQDRRLPGPAPLPPQRSHFTLGSR